MKFDAHQFWVSSIPDSWNWNRVSESFDVINGFPFDSESFSSSEDGPPLVRIRDILSLEFTTFYVGQNGLDVVVKNGDIVIGMDGDFNSCWWMKGNALLNQRVAALRPKSSPQVDGRFAFYQVPFGLKVINDLTPSSTVKHLSSGDIAALRLPAPDLTTQKRIAAFLDRETARIDALIAKNEVFLGKARENWRATLNHTIFPGSPDWNKLPEGWQKTCLKYLTDQQRPVMYGIVLPGPDMPEGPMIVKGGDVKPGRLSPDLLCRTTPEIEASYVRSRLRAGDLVISIRGGIGDIELVPPEIEGANLTQDAARIAPRLGIDRHWLRYALLSSAVFHPLEARSLGAAVRGINIFDLKRVFVPTPPAEQQEAIAAKLVVHEKRLLALQGKVELLAARLREYRAALITAAVTGQIDVDTYGRAGATSATLDRIEKELQE